MKERPILFSAPMVRAILSGQKTQTRRIVKPQPHVAQPGPIPGAGICAITTPDDQRLGRLGKVIQCPYGQPGDRLWVRENFCQDGQWCLRLGAEPDDPAGRFWSGSSRILYAADQHAELPPPIDSMNTWRSRPSIHMPRWASRILLEITGVRVQRLQDISEDDAYAEGVTHAEQGGINARDGFSVLWNKINGAGSWAANPWVWAMQFRRVDQ